jgi:MFS family permease
MVDLDAAILDAELKIYALLLFQTALMLVAWLLGYLSGRQGRTKRMATGFFLALAVSVVTCGFSLYLSSQLRNTVRGRLAGEIVGPYISKERAEKCIMGAMEILWRVRRWRPQQ